MDITNDRSAAQIEYEASLDELGQQEEELDLDTASAELTEALAFEDNAYFIERAQEEGRQNQGEEDQQGYQTEDEEEQKERDSAEPEQENSENSQQLEQESQQRSNTREQLEAYLSELREEDAQEKQQADRDTVGSEELAKLEKNFQKSLNTSSETKPTPEQLLASDRLQAAQAIEKSQKTNTVQAAEPAHGEQITNHQAVQSEQMQTIREQQAQQLQQTLKVTTMLDPTLMGGLLAFQTTAPLGIWMMPTKDNRVKQVKEVKEEAKGKGGKGETAGKLGDADVDVDQAFDSELEPDSKTPLTQEEKLALQLEQLREQLYQQYGHWMELRDEEQAVADQQQFLQMLVHNSDHICLDPSGGQATLRCCWLYWLMTQSSEPLMQNVKRLLKAQTSQALEQSLPQDQPSSLEQLTVSFFDGYRLLAPLESALFEPSRSCLVQHASHRRELDGPDSLALMSRLFQLPLIMIEDMGTELIIKDIDLKAVISASGEAPWRILQDHDIDWDQQNCFIYNSLAEDQLSLLVKPDI